jgi:hypothetical protein
MRPDLNSLKKELSRLTDIKYLKKELNRIAGEVRNFQVRDLPLTPQARQRIEQLEKRFRELMKNLAQVQKQVDTNFDKLMKVVRRKGKSRKATAKKAAKKATTRKATKAKR